MGGRLWKRGLSPGLSPFRSLHDHVPRWLANASEHPLAPLANDLYATLEKRNETLVHGDLHHHNILRSARGPLAWIARATSSRPVPLSPRTSTVASLAAATAIAS